MKNVLKKIWFPAVVVCALALQTAGMGSYRAGDPGYGFVTASKRDTIKYRNQFLRNRMLNMPEDTSALVLELIDTTPVITARDTIFPPDSLRLIDPFRYKYYVAILDSLTHRIVSDSLKAAGDSIDWPVLDSLYYLDSAARKKAEFDAWYAGLSKTERKKYEFEKKSRAKQHVADSVLAVKDSIAAVKDSILEARERILETFAVTDSLQYKRLITWTHEREFHKLDMREPDTSYNYRFYDYPALRNDVNATWLGVAGSPVQYYNFFNRNSENGVAFYDPYESWSYSPSTVHMYNTKTAYTELSYFGTILANTEKESDNLHILTTQNIFPELNFSLEYDRFGGGGMLENEETKNKTFAATTNYLGKRYMMHAGYLFNSISREENGGINDRSMVQDTTLDARDINTYLVQADAKTHLKKNTVFIDQQYRIPFTFLKNLKYSKVIKAENAYRDSIMATNDSLAIAEMEALLAARQAERESNDTIGNKDITSAFIGHSSEYSVFHRTYRDEISSADTYSRNFYDNSFLYDPTTTSDSLRVMKLENKVFIRLQPWSSEGIVSKLNAGIGNRIMNFYTFDPSYLSRGTNTVWNSTYLYAGVEGQLKDYIHWDALGNYTFLGEEINDFSIKANAQLNMFPFRRARKSPVSLNLHFETSLKEPDFYYQKYRSNHYSWDNDFDKISTTKVQGSLSVPRWNIALEAGYALLDKNIYFDSTGVIRQNSTPMSVLSASLTKNFTLFNFIHLDNKILFQLSSDEDVIPLPMAAINARYYIQFNVKKNVMQMQLGANAWVNTSYYSPGWNPALGTFYNQKEAKYNNGPYIDAFMNVQWKRACIFIKVENVGQGWPMDKKDYFSAHNYIRTQRSVKLGLYWPFYKQPNANTQVKAGSGLSGGGGNSSGGGSALSSFGR